MWEITSAFRGTVNCTAIMDRFRDPWGEPYVYRRIADTYELYSKGPDRLPKTADDVTVGWQSDECKNQRADENAVGTIEQATTAPPDAANADAGSAGSAGTYADVSSEFEINLPVAGGTPAERRIEVPPSPRGCGCSFVGLGQ